MRRPRRLRLLSLVGALTSLAVALLGAYLVHRLLGRGGRVGFDGFNLFGVIEGGVFVVAYTTGLRYARWVLRLPGPTLLSFGLVTPPEARRVAFAIPSVDASRGLQSFVETRIVLVQDRSVPIGLTGVRRERIVPWDEVAKVDGRVAVTELRALLAHELLVVVLDRGRLSGVVTQEMYLAGLWKARR